MRFKLFSLSLFLMVVLYVPSSNAEEFVFMDIFRKPLGELAQKLFTWNPFKSKIAEPEIASVNSNSFGTFEITEGKNETEIKRHYTYGCLCKNFTCSCCAHIDVGRVHLNETGCMNITYLNQDYGVEVTFDLNNKIFYNKTISVANPPEMCFEVPYLPESAKLCLKLYKLDARNRSLSGCADLIVKLASADIARFKLGCFKLGNGSHYFEQNLMSLYFNKKDFSMPMNELDQDVSEFNQAGKNLFVKTYENILNKFRKFTKPFETSEKEPIVQEVIEKTNVDEKETTTSTSVKPEPKSSILDKL